MKGNIQREFERIQGEFQVLKSNVSGGGLPAAADVGGGKLGGFIPWKSMTPKAFGGKEEGWRDWVDEIRDYMDLIRPGMKQLLIDAEMERDATIVDVDWACNRSPALGAESVAVWRALKKLTEEGAEARQVVTSVPREDGYAA